MHHLPEETILIRRRVCLALLAFWAGLLGITGGLVWLLAIFLSPTWLGMISLVLTLWWVPFFGGCCTAIATMWVYDWWYFDDWRSRTPPLSDGGV